MRQTGPMDLPVIPPVAPMLAKPVAEIPPGQLYEPKWDGFRSIIFRDGDEVEIGSRNERPMTRYFPEVVAAVLANFPDARGDRRRDHRGRHRAQHARLRGAAAAHPPGREPGEAAGRADAGELRRVRPAGAGRRRPHRAALRASAASGSSRPSPTAQPPVHVTPATRDLATARRWFEQFEGAGLDGLIAKPPT